MASQNTITNFAVPAMSSTTLARPDPNLTFLKADTEPTRKRAASAISDGNPASIVPHLAASCAAEELRSAVPRRCDQSPGAAKLLTSLLLCPSPSTALPSPASRKTTENRRKRRRQICFECGEEITADGCCKWRRMEESRNANPA